MAHRASLTFECLKTCLKIYIVRAFVKENFGGAIAAIEHEVALRPPITPPHRARPASAPCREISLLGAHPHLTPYSLRSRSPDWSAGEVDDCNERVGGLRRICSSESRECASAGQIDG
ncbi:hypothetical protein PT2222_30092 [Paraburkholderia tropica]